MCNFNQQPCSFSLDRDRESITFRLFVAVSRRFVTTRPECLHFRLRPTVKNQQTDSNGVIFRASDFPDRGSSGNEQDNATRSEDVQAQMKLRANLPPGVELSPAKASEKTRRSGQVNSRCVLPAMKKKLALTIHECTTTAYYAGFSSVPMMTVAVWSDVEILVSMGYHMINGADSKLSQIRIYDVIYTIIR